MRSNGMTKMEHLNLFVSNYNQVDISVLLMPRHFMWSKWIERQTEAVVLMLPRFLLAAVYKALSVCLSQI